ncbi:uncharacterized protein LOC112590675 [Harpegnathos saltator]|uniref:uncharacterized protein LOC112590675 n=1 Tax=Harpegnathos saltator TaxID=610380 RepID=UPI000DBED423|nr:uncharacterized protein LOC112590675 [Harpegnathos saltator]
MVFSAIMRYEVCDKFRNDVQYVNEEQKSLLVEFMRKHPELHSGKFSATFTFKHVYQKYFDQDHAKATGGGPASSQVLTKMDQNVLPIMGTTVVGHKIVQESNVQIEWIDDSIVCEINDDENRNNFPIKYKSQEITQQSEILKKTETTALETPISVVNNISDFSVTPASKSSGIQRGVKRIAAAQRYDKSIEQTEKLVKISQEDSEIRKSYYAQKLKLYKKNIALKEKDINIKENTCTLLEQLVKKSNERVTDIRYRL